MTFDPIPAPLPVLAALTRKAAIHGKKSNLSLWVSGLYAWRAYDYHGHTGADGEIAVLEGCSPSAIEDRRHAIGMYRELRNWYGGNSVHTLRIALTITHFASAWRYWNAGFEVPNIYENLMECINKKLAQEKWSVDEFEKEIEPEKIRGGRNIKMVFGQFKDVYSNLWERHEKEIQDYGKSSLPPAVVTWLGIAPEEVKS